MSDTSPDGIERFAKVDETIPNGGRGRDGSHRTLGRWTFEYEPAREFVENRLHGRVLNACAGKTKLDHDGEVVRNDLNPERDADLHVDHFVPGEFDVVVFDPPFDDTQADDKYDGLRADSLLEAFEEFQKLVRPHGRVITFGWNSWGMSSIDAFDREETVLLQRGPCLRDVIVTVDRRTNGSIRLKRSRNGRDVQPGIDR
jgi:hypothetical protein